MKDLALWKTHIRTQTLNSDRVRGFLDPLKSNNGPPGAMDPKLRTPELKVPMGKHFPLSRNQPRGISSLPDPHVIID